ncbi:MAG TPA: hypothetical protein VD947_00525 [Patescibacteria group bacterium]|nr:hypothetical protein [Patescibacteria group bacterium]
MMKQKDVVLIVIVVIFAGIVSIIATNFFFTPDNAKNLTAAVVDPITSDFQQPDERVFNSKAINPTQLIEIGDSKNTQPF